MTVNVSNTFTTTMFSALPVPTALGGVRYSTRSFAFVARVVWHCIFEGASAPPRLSTTTRVTGSPRLSTDVAAWFGVNGGRIGEIACGYRFRNVEAAPTQLLPPPGPYLSGRDTAILMHAISKARGALDTAEAFIRGQPR